MKRTIIAPACLLILAALLLSGCLGADGRITIQEDGSGRVEIAYRLSKLVAYLGAGSTDGATIALPIDEESILASVDDLPGVSLDSYSFTDDDEDILVEVVLDFESIEGLEAMFTGIEGPQVSFESGDTNSTFVLMLSEGLETTPDADVSDMVETFFSDYQLIWQITAPSDVISASHGSWDGARATATFDTSEIMLSSEPVEWRVDW